MDGDHEAVGLSSVLNGQAGKASAKRLHVDAAIKRRLHECAFG